MSNPHLRNNRRVVSPAYKRRRRYFISIHRHAARLCSKHAPPQLNVDPEEAEAVKVTEVPELNFAVATN